MQKKLNLPLTSKSVSFDQNSNDPPNNVNSEKGLCKFYKKGTCKFGRTGCPYEHPKICRKLLVPGNKGPCGCQMGTKCQYFHPRMCSSSITNNLMTNVVLLM